jgi:type I restriction enzyme M protein
MAFVQHMVSSMEKDGRLAVVLPNGCFFRGGPELAVRKDLVAADLIEAVVQLPVDLFYGAGIPACVLVCNGAKTGSNRGRVLMVDASSSFDRRDTKNVLTPEGVARIVSAARSGEEEDSFACFATLEEIATRDFNLTVRRYVGVAEDVGDDAVDPAEAVAAYRAARQRRREAEQQLDTILAPALEQ